MCDHFTSNALFTTVEQIANGCLVNDPQKDRPHPAPRPYSCSLPPTPSHLLTGRLTECAETESAIATLVTVHMSSGVSLHFFLLGGNVSLFFCISRVM